MSAVVKNKKFKATPVENKENDVPVANNSQRIMSSTIVKSSSASFRNAPVAKVVPTTTTVLMPSDGDYSSHPRYLQVMSMKVAELKKELKTLKLDGPGLKKDLQKRLLAATCPNKNDDNNGKQQHNNDSVEEDEQPRSLPVKSPFAIAVDEDDEMEVDEKMVEVAAQKKKDEDRMSFVDTDPVDIKKKETKVQLKPPAPEKAAPTQPKPVVAKVVQSKPPPAKPVPPPPRSESVVKSTAALFSPKPIASKFQQPRPQEKPKPILSPMQVLKKSITKTALNISSSARKLMSVEAAAPADDDKSTIAQVGSTDAKETEGTGLSSAVKISNNGGMETSMTHAFSSSVKEKQKALAEARKQRLAEMRGKSKPVALTKSVKEIALASNTKIANQSDEKRNLLTAKIREKHAAALKGGNSSSAIKGGNSSKSKASPFTVPTKKPLVSAKSVEKELRSPMSTYEISDREEESDSDESDCSDAAPRKNIPKWAQKENLITALKSQYDDTNLRVDPDALFPEVETCDLEAIFEGDKKKNRYKKRTSSGNWTKDRVTAAEKLVYKRTMGFQTSKSSSS